MISIDEPVTAVPSSNIVPETPKTESEYPQSSLREMESERLDLESAYISQLKENNKVLKDLMKNKNKEIISLEMQIKKDKLQYIGKVSLSANPWS